MSESTQYSTAVDRDEQLNAEFRALTCRQCGTEVRVRKRSIQQTSVQWQCDATAGCPYLSRPTPGAAPAEGCPELSGTIRDAVRAGLVPSGTSLPSEIPLPSPAPIPSENL